MASFECLDCGHIEGHRSGVHCCGDDKPEICSSCGSANLKRVSCCGSR